LAALRIRSELEAELDRRGLMTLGEVRGKMLGQSRVVDLK
jgi:hypothetical protein